MHIHIVCQNWKEDRVIPRMARALRDALGWTLGLNQDPAADVTYLLGYFEASRMKPWPNGLTAAYFTHREEEPAGNAKARLFDGTAKRVDLRVAMCRLYGDTLSAYGPTIVPPLPVESQFKPHPHKEGGGRPIVGLAGYTYPNHRKGEDLARGILESRIGQKCEWRASGRGWPIETTRRPWAEMPAFYQALDVLVCPSRVEGGPLPVLEALACGVQVVVPSGVGIIDELPDVVGIWRYPRGDLAGMIEALERALSARDVDPEELAATVAGYSVEAFVEAHRVGFGEAFGAGAFEFGTRRTRKDAKDAKNDKGNDGEGECRAVKTAASACEVRLLGLEGQESGQVGGRGIYCVAFGTLARACALRMMESAKRQMPDIPIALCAAKKIGPEDVLIIEPDSDVGGRRAKLRAYELAPAEWQAVLYLDADTEVVAPIYPFFEWIEDGWEFVITKDPHLMDEVANLRRRNNGNEMDHTEKAIGTVRALMWNGGVWAFGRNDRIARFFRRWQAEWEVHANRDQGALLRAMYADPLKIFLLGNEWNTFDRYSRGVVTAGLRHFPGDARRWTGMIPGRIDSPGAWEMVRKHEQGRR